MNLARVSIPALVFAFLTVSPGVFSQGTVQQYAQACYLAIGDPSKATDANPFTSNGSKTGLDCKTGTEINIGGGMVDAAGRCLSPSWAPTHSKVPGGNVDYQCFPDSWVKTFTYTNPESMNPKVSETTVTGAVLCKNEKPADKALIQKGMFDYVSMILYNNKSGLSCWFAAPKADTGLPPDVTSIRDGKNVPDPSMLGADAYWEAPDAVAAANCWRCHDNGVWMNSPWFYVSNTPVPFTDLPNQRGFPTAS